MNKLHRILKFKSFAFGAFFLLSANFFHYPLFSEQVYDEHGNLIRSSQWLPGSAKQKEKVALDAEETGESKNTNDSSDTKTDDEKSSERTFTKKQIENSHSSSLGDFLKQKGFFVMTTGAYGSKQELSFKGFTSFCIKVYVDGIYANNPATGEFDWNSIDINSIESIEICEQPGIDSAEFAGCVVYITTSSQNPGEEKSMLSTETAISTYESNFFDSIYQNINYIGSSKDFFYKINATFAYYENEYYKGSSDAINTFNFAHMGTLGFSWNAKASKNFSLYGSDFFAYNQVKAYATGPVLTTGVEDDYTTQNNFCADFKYDNFETTTILSYFYGQVDYLEGYSYSKPVTNVTNAQAISLRQNMTFKFDNDLPLNLTVSYKEDHSYSSNADRHQIESGISKSWNWDWFTLKPSLVLLAYGGNLGSASTSASSLASSASSTAFSSTSSSTTTTDNTTWDTSGLHTGSWTFAALPRLTFELGDVTVAAYRVFTLPTFNQLYWPSTSYAVGNPELKAETGWATTIAYSKKDFPLFARMTYTYYENKIRWATIEGVLIPQNTSNADFYALTIGYEQKVWQSEKSDSNLTLQADFSLNEARLRETYKQIMWVPEYQSHAAIFFKYKGFQTEIDYAFTSKRYKTNENESFYPAMHLLGASLSYQFNAEFQIYAKGSNLLDQRVVYHDNYYIPSRKWTLGLKFRK